MKTMNNLWPITESINVSRNVKVVLGLRRKMTATRSFRPELRGLVLETEGETGKLTWKLLDCSSN